MFVVQAAQPIRLNDESERLLILDRGTLPSLLAERVDPNGTRLAALRSELGDQPADGSSVFDPLPDVEKAGDPLPPTSPLKHSAERWRFLAMQAVMQKHYALADDFLRRSLRREPNDPETRRLLGFVRLKADWVSPEAAKRLLDGQVLHPTFGWVPEDWLHHLDSGELPAPSTSPSEEPRWVPAAEADAARIGDFRRAWEISTPHYNIKANTPLAEGIDNGRRLEAFYQLFVNRMANVIGNDRLPLAALARKPSEVPSASTQRPHTVYYFATKESYVEFLAPTEGPAIGKTLGVYLPADAAKKRGDQPRSYFHDDPEGRIAVEATLYHEVSHQLLFELSGLTHYERNTGDYWVFEGLGTYFETTRVEPDGTIRLGGHYGPRMAEAGIRCLQRKEFLPVREFVRLDRAGFNKPDHVHANYAQAIALTAFLMDGDAGQHRQGFLTYVADAHKGRLRDPAGRSLEDRLGIPYAEIDRRLVDYMKLATPQPPPPGVTGCEGRR
jgi:Protein of unknown function (DUF1570)